MKNQKYIGFELGYHYTPYDASSKVLIPIQANYGSLELFFRFDHFRATSLDENIPSLDQMKNGRTPNLDMSPNKLFVDDAYIKESIYKPMAKIVQGYGPVMPAMYEGKLTDENIADIIEYLKTLK
jgi:hypothetical protein